MGYRNRRLPGVAVAAALLALGSGCVTSDANKSTSNKPDVTKPGVLPSPQELMGPTPGSGSVVQTGGTQPALAAPPVTAAPAAPPAAGGLALPKISVRSEKKAIAREIAVAWRSNIDYLPDPTRNGVMSPGLAGQLFLFGGPKLEFVPADGVLTVDMIDETPRPDGQPAATPERWQFNADMLRTLVAKNDTFGKSYVLFLPWPAYRADITRVKISARYDQGSGDTLYVPPSTVSLSKKAPVIDRSSYVTTGVMATGLPSRPTGDVPLGAFGGSPAPSNFGPPIPLGGGSSSGAGLFQSPLGAGALPPQPQPQPQPPSAPGVPAGAMPVAPSGAPPGTTGTR